MMIKKMTFGLAPLLAVAAFMVVPAMASAVEWTNGGGVGNLAVVTKGELTLAASNGAEVKCNVKDKGTVELGGINDEISEFTNEECTSNLESPCNAEPALKVLAENLPWKSELSLDEGVIRDLILGIKVLIECGSTPIALFEGSLHPKVVNNEPTFAEFDAGSGELVAAGSEGTVTAKVSGNDSIEMEGGGKVEVK